MKKIDLLLVEEGKVLHKFPIKKIRFKWLKTKHTKFDGTPFELLSHISGIVFLKNKDDLDRMCKIKLPPYSSFLIAVRKKQNSYFLQNVELYTVGDTVRFSSSAKVRDEGLNIK